MLLLVIIGKLKIDSDTFLFLAYYLFLFNWLTHELMMFSFFLLISMFYVNQSSNFPKYL